MSKLDKIGYYNKETGEDISDEIFKSIKIEEDRSEIANIFKIIEENPNNASLMELNKYFKIKNLNTKLNTFAQYHILNEEFDLELFEKGISMKAFYYFKKLVSLHCSNTYTLQHKSNHKIINTDIKVSESLNISVDSWRKIKKELIELNLLRIVKFENIKYYKVNPCYIGKKKILSPNTYFAFREDIIQHKLLNPLQILWWDKFMLEEFGIKYEEVKLDVELEVINIS